MTRATAQRGGTSDHADRLRRVGRHLHYCSVKRCDERTRMRSARRGGTACERHPSSWRRHSATSTPRADLRPPPAAHALSFPPSIHPSVRHAPSISSRGHRVQHTVGRIAFTGGAIVIGASVRRQRQKAWAPRTQVDVYQGITLFTFQSNTPPLFSFIHSPSRPQSRAMRSSSQLPS
jgi:hypothetical protein